MGATYNMSALYFAYGGRATLDAINFFLYVYILSC